MNRLQIPNGGMPLEGDDFRWMQDGYAEAFKGVFSEIVNRVPTTGHSNTFGNFIISGCEITDIGGGNSSVSSGFVFIDGEILFAPAVASTPNATITNTAYRLLSYFDAAGQEVFQDTTTQDTYEVRIAELHIYGGSPSEKCVFVSYPQYRLKSLLTNADVYSLRDINVESTLDNGWGRVDFPSIDEDILVTKKFGMVNIRGRIIPGTFNATAFTLDTEFRPKVGVEFLCPWNSDGIVLISIGTDGSVTPIQIIASATTPGSINLSPINFTRE